MNKSHNRNQSQFDDSDMNDWSESIISYGRDLQNNLVLDFHQHNRTQLIYASEGVMVVKTRFGAYLVPPQRAVWMPAGVEHQIEARKLVKMRTLYIDSKVAQKINRETCVLQVSPLLRELIVEVVAGGMRYGVNSVQSRLMAVILDQLKTQPRVPLLSLPMPDDSRLRKIAQALIDNPSDKRELNDWSKLVGASVRTLVRLFPRQTGMTFRQWRQQRRLFRSLELLASGESITNVGLELGYESTSAFIAMFRRSFGTTPRRYFQPTE